jgi:hypothetical protein
MISTTMDSSYISKEVNYPNGAGGVEFAFLPQVAVNFLFQWLIKVQYYYDEKEQEERHGTGRRASMTIVTSHRIDATAIS